MCKLEQDIENTKSALQKEQISIPQMFIMIDDNNTGRITTYEMCSALKQLFGISAVNQEDMDYIFRLHTPQYNGYITLEDFSKLFYPIFGYRNPALMEEKNYQITQSVKQKISSLF